MESGYNKIGIMQDVIVFRGNDISKINSIIALCKNEGVDCIASALSTVVEWSTGYSYSYYALDQVFNPDGEYTKIYDMINR